MGRAIATRLIVPALACALLSPGCATVTRRSTQRIPVTSSPAGATVLLRGFVQGATPLELRLARKAKDQVIRIESAGYDPVEIRLKRRLSGIPIFGNLLLGGGAGLTIGGICYLFPGVSSNEAYWIWALSGMAIAGGLILVDSGAGSGYALEPKELVVTLTKSDGPPRIHTILLDADELKNIKWIRARQD